MWVHERLRETDPGLRERRAQLKERIAGSISSGEASRVAAELITIPTVVHVVHRTEEENVSDEQVASQLEVLNQDFRAQNEDAKNVPEVWSGLVADAKIQFELATEDPQGDPTSGIVRTETDQESFAPDDDPVKSTESGGAAPWPTDRYLNIRLTSITA